MARRNRKLAYIVNDAKRNATYKPKRAIQVLDISSSRTKQKDVRSTKFFEAKNRESSRPTAEKEDSESKGDDVPSHVQIPKYWVY
ncbi:hypothetical protein TanjilG_11402 [Lupinus angustifolius]|uniref:Uncharacterized protein n=1 Tax=Lupinus angustifolius TaxID=3871 RepID=A0A1J7IGK0_LUPAN|nr:hypothetical protein TanjilG_11402 [Lupinus angustifolius]